MLVLSDAELATEREAVEAELAAKRRDLRRLPVVESSNGMDKRTQGAMCDMCGEQLVSFNRPLDFYTPQPNHDRVIGDGRWLLLHKNNKRTALSQGQDRENATEREAAWRERMYWPAVDAGSCMEQWEQVYRTAADICLSLAYRQASQHNHVLSPDVRALEERLAIIDSTD